MEDFMKLVVTRSALFGLIVSLAAPLMAADAKDDITSAAKKLADAPSYSWKSTPMNASAGQGGGGGGGRFRMGPTEGKTEKEGYTHLSMQRGDNTVEAVIKGDKAAIKMEDGWKSAEELAQDDGS